MQKYLILFFCSILYGHTFPKTTSLNGAWSYYKQNLPKSNQHVYTFDGNEKTMKIPNNWYLNGINYAGIIWFKKTINTKNLPAASTHFLTFNGVDYLCDVWVNNQFVGSNTGYFNPFEFDISSYLNVGDNDIQIRVNSPLENYPTNYSLHKTLLRGIFSHHDTRPGGAWSALGQDKNSGGIWADVAIKSYKHYKLSDLKITPVLETNGVKVDIKVIIDKLQQSSHSSLLYYKQSKQQQNVKISFVPYNFNGVSYNKIFKLDNDKAQHFTFFLKDAKHWYTHDRGFPHLYTMTLEMDDTKLSQNVGFKQLYQNDKEQYVLNNTPLFLKGTNYISSQYLSEMNKNKFKKDLLLMKKAHINTIRVHAHIEPKMFYDLCDEMGFLVWQDYNLQWGYIEDDSFRKEAHKQMLTMVDQLYNHASIMLWSIHNEPPYNSEWMKWKYENYSNKQNKNLDTFLYDALIQYDAYHITKKLSSNLEHPWFGWYTGVYQDFSNPSLAKTISEYGAQALPNLSSLQKILPSKYLIPKNKKAKKIWEYHNFQFDWSEKNGLKYQDDLKVFIEQTQTYQAKLIKYATEMLRLQKYENTTAIFQFMFNEGWPSMNWGIVDYYRKTKLGYHALKEAYAPIIIVTKQNENNLLEFYVVNDTLHAMENCTLTVDVSTDGRDQTYIYPVSSASDSVTKVNQLQLESNATIHMQLMGKNVDIKNVYNLTLNSPKKEKKDNE
ncbi:MAG: glycoside hydrolase family 2 TIM barrel-domain containing protein [Campylobacterota bacterium]|nr:glycoside hydrolase family 2 TIM barrel-domain containing protein [Campylobacterota bacterium]